MLDTLKSLTRGGLDIERVIWASSYGAQTLPGWTGLARVIADGKNGTVYDIDIREASGPEFLKQDLVDAFPCDSYEGVNKARHKVIIYKTCVGDASAAPVDVKEVPARFVNAGLWDAVTHVYAKADASVPGSGPREGHSAGRLPGFSTTGALTGKKPDNIQNLPPSTERKGEGGLRTKGLFKRSSADKPLISIVTVVFNCAEYVEQTIQSVINQTYGNIEYVIVDGGSTDGTMEIIRKYEDEIDYWVSEPDGGIVNGMNKGVMLCTGEYIGMIHADDWYELDAVEKVARSATTGNYGVICGELQHWDGSRKGFLSASRPELLGRTMSIGHPTCFVKREAYAQYGLFRGEYRNAMDYELLLRLYVNGAAFLSIDAVLANMRQGGNSYRTWKACQRENFAARRKLMPGSWRSGQAYFLLYYTKVASALWLERRGLQTVVRAYRKNFSALRKR